MEKYGLEIQGYYIQAWKREGNKNVRLILASFHARSEKTKDHRYCALASLCPYLNSCKVRIEAALPHP
jgi:hypothetical protein